jgi:hypothetical protein
MWADLAGRFFYFFYLSMWQSWPHVPRFCSYVFLFMFSWTQGAQAERRRSLLQEHPEYTYCMQ